MKERTLVVMVDKLRPGQLKKIPRVDGRRGFICIVNVNGEFAAFNDSCPHQGASLSGGTVSGSMLPSAPHEYEYGAEGCILRCPWHGWEFDMRTGQSLFGPGARRLGQYSVVVDEGGVFIEH